jgi:hypothetical protein
VLDQIGEQDVILDIGAGDLRLARQMAIIARKVYAVEVNAQVLDQASSFGNPLPANLTSIRADARTMDFPTDITTGVLMMRHCTCFQLYAERLQKAGATRLITNARWRMDVEVIDLLAQRKSFAEVEMGWFACLCGGTGFREGPVERWSFEMDRITNEVSSCPHCMEVLNRGHVIPSEPLCGERHLPQTHTCPGVRCQGVPGRIPDELSHKLESFGDLHLHCAQAQVSLHSG